jgi:hypothetical protein
MSLYHGNFMLCEYKNEEDSWTVFEDCYTS